MFFVLDCQNVIAASIRDTYDFSFFSDQINPYSAEIFLYKHWFNNFFSI